MPNGPPTPLQVPCIEQWKVYDSFRAPGTGSYPEYLANALQTQPRAQEPLVLYPSCPG